MTEPDINEGYQILVCNIKWGSRSSSGGPNRRGSKIELPLQLSLDIPSNVLEQARKNRKDFNDIVEQFVYNLLWKKYGNEVNRCQIWLPLENA